MKLLSSEVSALIRNEGAGTDGVNRRDLEPAIRHVEAVVAPGPAEVETARLLILAGLQQQAAETGAGFQGNAKTRSQVPAYLEAAADALGRAFARRAELGEKGRGHPCPRRGGPQSGDRT